MLKRGPRNIGFLNLLHYRLPLAGIVSILHRISGVIVFLFIPFLIWLLKISLSSEWNFIEVKAYFGSFLVGTLVWITLSALFYHLIAGLRHLFMDFGYCESLKTSRYTSMLILFLSVVFAVFLAFFIFA